ncbi:MAG TPA: acyl carrier protein [Thermoanaerobaculia bacterium]|nr:acyl carrier protein [Thermoanaerobaculia bacterium]
MSNARPREASPNDALPFGEFLTALRARGVPVGVKEYESVARLLRAWSGIEREPLRDALAALLARDQKEVETIRHAFDEWFPAEPAEVRVRSRRPVVIAVAVLLLVATAAIGEVWYRRVAWPTKAPRLATPVQAVPQDDPLKDVAAEAAPLPPPPALPPPPRADDRVVPLLLAAGLALLLALVAAELRTRRRRRDWKESYLEETLESGTGPTRYTPVVSHEQPLVPEAWMDEVASILGRGPDDSPGTHLDVNESLRLTLRHGMRPHLAFEPPPRNAFLLLLEDVHWAMRPWRRKIDAFVAGLGRHRVDHERWYFDGDPALVWRNADEQPVPLAQLFATRGAASLLIVSTGEAARAVEENPTVQDTLRRWTFRSWLNPVANPAYWGKELDRLPVRVWPFTRDGLRGIAWDLARMPQVANEDVGDTARDVTADDVERMKRLIALVPRPTAALADELRRRYASDIPEEVVLFLIAEGAFRGEQYQLPAEELARLLATLRADAPSRELQIRKYLLEVLRDSEPERGSIAHLRWQLDVAMQRLHVARSGETETAPAIGALTELAAGPLRHEVQGAVAQMPEGGAVTVLQRRVRRAGEKLPATIASDAGRPPRFAFPGVVGLIVVAALTFLAWTQFAFYFGDKRGAEIPHVYDAYELRMLAPQRGGDAAILEVLPRRLGAPYVFELWRDQRSIASSVTEGLVFSLNVPQDQAGGFFQVRARLPQGNLAVSDAVWVPPATIEQRVIAIIADVLNVDSRTIPPEADLRRDLSADSRTLDEIAKKIEQQFGQTIPLSTLRNVLVKDIIRLLRERNREFVRVYVDVWLGDQRTVATVVLRHERGQVFSVANMGEMIAVPPGFYTAEISIPGQPLTRQAVVIPSEYEYGLVLRIDPPATGTVVIKVPLRNVAPRDVVIELPSGKRTRWDGKPLQLQPGTVRVIVKTDYFDDTVTGQIVGGSTTELLVKPAAVSGVVLIETGDPGSQVTVAGKYRSLTRDPKVGRGIWKLVAAEGTYSITVTHAGLQRRDVVKVTNGVTTRHNLAVPETPQPRERLKFWYYQSDTKVMHQITGNGVQWTDEFDGQQAVLTRKGRTTVEGANGIILVNSSGLEMFVPDEGAGESLYIRDIKGSWRFWATIEQPASAF